MLPEIGYTNQAESEGGALTKIVIPKRSRVLYLSPVAGDGYAEREILISKNSQFRVLKDQEFRYYFLQYPSRNREKLYVQRWVPTNMVELLS